MSQALATARRPEAACFGELKSNWLNQEESTDGND